MSPYFQTNSFNCWNVLESDFMFKFPIITLYFYPKLFNLKQRIWRCIFDGIVWGFIIQAIPWIAITVHLICRFQIMWFVFCKNWLKLILYIKLSAIMILPLSNRWTPSFPQSLFLTQPLSMKVNPCSSQGKYKKGLSFFKWSVATFEQNTMLEINIFPILKFRHSLIMSSQTERRGLLFLSNISKWFVPTCRIAGSYPYYPRIGLVWWFNWFAFDPGKELRWATIPFSMLLNFFICNVFEKLSEKMKIFFGWLLSLLADNVYLVKLLFFLDNVVDFLCLSVAFCYLS